MRTRGATRGSGQAAGGGAAAGGAPVSTAHAESGGADGGGGGGEDLAAPGGDAHGLVPPWKMFIAASYGTNQLNSTHEGFTYAVLRVGQWAWQTMLASNRMPAI
jgi:hypothetical protein